MATRNTNTRAASTQRVTSRYGRALGECTRRSQSKSMRASVVISEHPALTERIGLRLLGHERPDVVYREPARLVGVDGLRAPGVHQGLQQIVFVHVIAGQVRLLHRYEIDTLEGGVAAVLSLRPATSE